MNEHHDEFMTPKEIAAILKVSVDLVRSWIQRTELRAVNVGNGTRKPRFRVGKGDFEAFLVKRTTQPLVVRNSQPRRHKIPEGGLLKPELGKELAKRGQAQLVGGTYYRVCDGVILFY